MLVEAAEMGNSDALYELGGRLRIEVCSSSFELKFLLLMSKLLGYFEFFLIFYLKNSWRKRFLSVWGLGI